jgi:hypothetical protein
MLFKFLFSWNGMYLYIFMYSMNARKRNKLNKYTL